MLDLDVDVDGEGENRSSEVVVVLQGSGFRKGDSDSLKEVGDGRAESGRLDRRDQVKELLVLDKLTTVVGDVVPDLLGVMMLW